MKRRDARRRLLAGKCGLKNGSAIMCAGANSWLNYLFFTS
jgi:hypothetical protein